MVVVMELVNNRAKRVSVNANYGSATRKFCEWLGEQTPAVTIEEIDKAKAEKRWERDGKVIVMLEKK
jgi:hypothetical protein